jgi:hypothetical protein
MPILTRPKSSPRNFQNSALKDGSNIDTKAFQDKLNVSKKLDIKDFLTYNSIEKLNSNGSFGKGVQSFFDPLTSTDYLTELNGVCYLDSPKYNFKLSDDGIIDISYCERNEDEGLKLDNDTVKFLAPTDVFDCAIELEFIIRDLELESLVNEYSWGNFKVDIKDGTNKISLTFYKDGILGTGLSKVTGAKTKCYFDNNLVLDKPYRLTFAYSTNKVLVALDGNVILLSEPAEAPTTSTENCVSINTSTILDVSKYSFGTFDDVKGLNGFSSIKKNPDNISASNQYPGNFDFLNLDMTDVSSLTLNGATHNIDKVNCTNGDYIDVNLSSISSDIVILKTKIDVITQSNEVIKLSLYNDTIGVDVSIAENNLNFDNQSGTINNNLSPGQNDVILILNKSTNKSYLLINNTLVSKVASDFKTASGSKYIRIKSGNTSSFDVLELQVATQFSHYLELSHLCLVTPVAPTSVALIVNIKELEVIDIQNDIDIEISVDGNNWEAFDIEVLGEFISGLKYLYGELELQNVGTEIKIKIQSSKNVEIHGIGAKWL